MTNDASSTWPRREGLTDVQIDTRKKYDYSSLVATYMSPEWDLYGNQDSQEQDSKWAKEILRQGGE